MATYDLFTPKDAIFFALALYEACKIDEFRFETSNGAEDSACYIHTSSHYRKIDGFLNPCLTQGA